MVKKKKIILIRDIRKTGDGWHIKIPRSRLKEIGFIEDDLKNGAKVKITMEQADIYQMNTDGLFNAAKNLVGEDIGDIVIYGKEKKKENEVIEDAEKT